MFREESLFVYNCKTMFSFCLLLYFKKIVKKLSKGNFGVNTSWAAMKEHEKSKRTSINDLHVPTGSSDITVQSHEFGHITSPQGCRHFLDFIKVSFSLMYQSIPGLTIPRARPQKIFLNGRIPHPSGTKKVQNSCPSGKKIKLKPHPRGKCFQIFRENNKKLGQNL